MKKQLLISDNTCSAVWLGAGSLYSWSLCLSNWLYRGNDSCKKKEKKVSAATQPIMMFHVSLALLAFLTFVLETDHFWNFSKLFA